MYSDMIEPSDGNYNSIADMRFVDTFGVKNKIRKLIFNEPKDLENILKAHEIITVSYTHLTLPTIYSV